MALDILAAKRKSWQHGCEHVLTVRLLALRLQRLVQRGAHAACCVKPRGWAAAAACLAALRVRQLFCMQARSMLMLYI